MSWAYLAVLAKVVLMRGLKAGRIYCNFYETALRLPDHHSCQPPAVITHIDAYLW